MRVNMRKTAAVLAASGAILAGCGGDGESLKRTPETPSTRTVPTPLSGYTGKPLTEADKRNCHRAPICDTLDKFRQRVIEKHRAKIILGLCIAWPNTENGITATINPGTVRSTFKDGEFSYPIFSAELNAGDAPYLEQMNGPVSVTLNSGKSFDESPDVILEYFRTDRTTETRDHSLSKDPVRDQAGNLHFEDTKTGEPLMATGLTKEPFNKQTAAASCKALRDHTPLPGVR
jgi:hypothetical protein